MTSKYELMEHLDRTAKLLKELDDHDQFSQWASFLLEAIESEVGIDALHHIKDILVGRELIGRW